MFIFKSYNVITFHESHILGLRALQIAAVRVDVEQYSLVGLRFSYLLRNIQTVSDR